MQVEEWGFSHEERKSACSIRQLKLGASHNSMTPDFDLQLLIHAVCHRPALWDRTLDVYKDRSEVVKCWDEVCLLLNEDFPTLSDARQDKFRRGVIGKWKVLRNSYKKAVDRMDRDRKSGVPESQFKKYIFHKEMEFLLKIFQYRTGDNNYRREISSQESADGYKKMGPFQTVPSDETVEGPYRDDLIEGPEEVDLDDLEETDATFHIILDNSNDPRSCTLLSSTKTTTPTSLNTSNETKACKKKRPRETHKPVEFEAKPPVENTSFHETTTSQETEAYKTKRHKETHNPVEFEAKTVENTTPTTFHEPTTFNETQAYKTKRPSETHKPVEFEAKTVENTTTFNETQAYKTKRPSETHKPVVFEAKSPQKVKIQNRHMAFMQGLLPTLNSFTDDEVLDFQAGALALIQNIKRARRIRF